MENLNNFQVSQEYEIIPHQKGKAYVISVKEWNFLKEKVSKIKIEINVLYTIGNLLLGTGITLLISIFVSDFKNDNHKNIFWVSFSFCFLFSIMGIKTQCT